MKVQKVQTKTRLNALPVSYTTSFITPGTVDYSAEGIGVVLVQKPALDRMMSTFVGKPCCLLHTDSDPETMFNFSGEEQSEKADGVVTAVWFDEKSGWYKADLLIWNKETQDAIDNDGYSVSCAYDVTDLDKSGGTYSNVEYQEEVLDGEYLHMAIVPNPRYERAIILKNSKSGGEVVKIKLFNRTVKNQPEEEKKPAPAPEAPAAEEVDAADAVVTIGEKDVPLEELVNAYMAKNAGPKRMNMEDEVEVDGKKMTVQELVSACGYGDKENAGEETMENAELLEEEAEDVSLENSAPEKKAPVNKALKNAAGQDSAPIKRTINTMASRLERGRKNY